MKEAMNVKISHGYEAASNGGGSGGGAAADTVSSSRVSSLLASQDRDYLLTPTGNQAVHRPSLLQLMLLVLWQRAVWVKVSDLDGKIIGLYFSANWYPPCWNFNQVLVGIYEQLKNSGTNFEIAYVSSDEDSDAFNIYHACMPWLAIPFSDLDTKKALNRKFDVESIPSLVILQPNDNKDEATLHDGVEIIYRYGVEAFPFTKQKLEELQDEDRARHENQTLTNLLTNHDRDYLLGHPTSKQVSVASLRGKTIGLYFSAQWCRPCVNFTPKLMSIYEKIKEKMLVDDHDGEDFEIVFVSSDRDQTSFDSYFNTMPWLALPFGDPNIKELVKHFDVKGIPCLVILGPDGKTVTQQGRNLINLYKENAYPFTDAKLELLEKKMDEEAKNLPRSVYHGGHRHELNLVSEGNGGGPFICCDCDEQGCGWAYQCLECGYEVHPKCVTAATPNSNSNSNR